MNQDILKIHLEALSSEQAQVLSKIKPFTDGWFLGGGTSLMLLLKHRRSFDFDFFSFDHMTETVLAQIVTAKPGTIEIIINKKEEVTFRLDEIKISFIEYPFKKIFDFYSTENNLKILTLKGVAAQKSYTIGRRGVWRDYYDIYSLIKSGFDLSQIITSAEEVYDEIFNAKLFLSQLVYFEDISDFQIEPLTDGLEITPAEQVKNFLQQEVKNYMDKQNI